MFEPRAICVDMTVTSWLEVGLLEEDSREWQRGETGLDVCPAVNHTSSYTVVSEYGTLTAEKESNLQVNML